MTQSVLISESVVLALATGDYKAMLYPKPGNHEREQMRMVLGVSHCLKSRLVLVPDGMFHVYIHFRDSIVCERCGAIDGSDACGMIKNQIYCTGCNLVDDDLKLLPCGYFVEMFDVQVVTSTPEQDFFC